VPGTSDAAQCVIATRWIGLSLGWVDYWERPIMSLTGTLGAVMGQDVGGTAYPPPAGRSLQPLGRPRTPTKAIYANSLSGR